MIFLKSVDISTIDISYQNIKHPYTSAKCPKFIRYGYTGRLHMIYSYLNLTSDWCLWSETPPSREHAAYMRRNIHNHQRERFPQTSGKHLAVWQPRMADGVAGYLSSGRGLTRVLVTVRSNVRKVIFLASLSWSPSVAQWAWVLQSWLPSWVRLSSTTSLPGLASSALFLSCFCTHLVCQGVTTEHTYFENFLIFQPTRASPPSLARCRDNFFHHMGFLLFRCLLRSVE